MNYITRILGRKPVSVPKLGRWGGVINNQNNDRLIDWANMDNGCDLGEYEPFMPDLQDTSVKNEKHENSKNKKQKTKLSSETNSNIRVNNNYTFDELLPFVM